MAKVFYDKIKNLEIHDISSKKTLEQIKQEFGDFDYQEVELLDDEVSAVNDGVLGKRKIVDTVDENEKLISERIKENQRSKAIADLKQEGKIPADFADDR